jgi:hypothetical protein
VTYIPDSEKSVTSRHIGSRAYAGINRSEFRQCPQTRVLRLPMRRPRHSSDAPGRIEASGQKETFSIALHSSKCRWRMLAAMLFMMSVRMTMKCLRRLARFIALAHLSSSAFGSEVAWSVLEERNPLSGGVLGVAEVELDTMKIMVRCESSQNWVEVRLFADRNLDAYSQQVTWQFDRAANRSAFWNRSPNGRSLIAPMNLRNEFIRGLRQHRMLNLTLQKDTGDIEQFTMPLNGSSAAIATAMRSCE